MNPARLAEGTERRSATEMRAAGRRLAGYAAVFNSEARIGAFRETIRPGAFKATLAARRDVVAVVDHDLSRLLGRTASGTLRLSEDEKGLAFELDLPDSTLGRDVLEMTTRGDLSKMSFSFRATDEVWLTRDHRELRSVDLIDVSLVTIAAYQATSLAVRSQQHADREMAAIRRRLEMEMA